MNSRDRRKEFTAGIIMHSLGTVRGEVVHHDVPAPVRFGPVFVLALAAEELHRDVALRSQQQRFT